MKVGKNTKIFEPQLSNIRDCEIGDNCTIHSHVWIGDGVKIGNNVMIQAFTFIPKGVTIDDNVFIGPRVTFTNDKHPPSWGKHWRDTHVKRGASIGASVTILPGVTIGEEAVIGAGSLVTKDIPDHTTAYGSPAKVRESVLQS